MICHGISLMKAVSARELYIIFLLWQLRAFFSISYFTLPSGPVFYEHFSRFLFLHCPRPWFTTSIFRCFSFSTAHRSYILRAFSGNSHFTLPTEPVSYERFPEIPILHCPQPLRYHFPLLDQPVQTACRICRACARQFRSCHSSLFFAVFMI